MPEDTTEEANPLTEIPLFSKFIAEQRNGQLDKELSMELARLSQAVTMLDKGGSLVLKIDIASMGDSKMVTISEKITVKVPEPDRPKGYAFVNNAGGLSREDPRQQKIPFLATLDPTEPPELASLPESESTTDE